MVDLPHPLGPTSAVVLPDGIDRFNPCNTGAADLVGYAKYKSWILISPCNEVGRFPSWDNGSSSDGLSIMENSSAAAEEALVIDWTENMVNSTEVAPNVTLRTYETLENLKAIRSCSSTCAYLPP